MTWRAGATVYRAQVIVDRSRYDQGEIRLLTVPPIHAAKLIKLPSGRWRADWLSMMRAGLPLLSYADMEGAMRDVARILGLATGREMSRFSWQQRVAIGQQLCPRLINDLGKTDICREPPEIGTIWCKGHLSEMR